MSMGSRMVLDSENIGLHMDFWGRSQQMQGLGAITVGLFRRVTKQVAPGSLRTLQDYRPRGSF